ncbi:hypothetical protein FHW73_002629 [Luteimonas sp. RC10]|nr:hypothetical protein [Luteimonas sp. RC10]
MIQRVFGFISLLFFSFLFLRIVLYFINKLLERSEFVGSDVVVMGFGLMFGFVSVMQGLSLRGRKMDH